MNCYNVRYHLEKMAAGEIKGSLERQLLEHLRSCSGCRGEYQEMKQALEMNQEPESGGSLRFNPVWRQRIRQDAFEREAGRRGFFAVFKANTLIPALGVLAVILVFIVFGFFNRFASENQVAEEETYQLRIISIGSNGEKVRKVIDNFKEEHEGGTAVTYRDRKSGLTYFNGVSEQEMTRLKEELEKAGAVVEVKVEVGK